MARPNLENKTEPRPPVMQWPSSTQILRQVGITLVVVVVWAVLYTGFLQIARQNARSQAGIAFGGSIPSDTISTEMTVQAETSMPAEESTDISFASDVQPILKRRCVKCHGGEKTEEGLILTTYDGLMNGSWNGTVIEPGKSEDSLLVEMIIEGDMPKNEPALLPAEIRTITAWVDAGTPNN